MLRNLLIISSIWTIIILIMSGIPGSSLPSTSFQGIPHFDKIVHVGLYFPLSFFIMAELSLAKKSTIKKYSSLFSLLVVAMYGGSIELAQDYIFIQRSADWMDFASDLFGGLLGIIFYYLIGRRILKI